MVSRINDFIHNVIINLKHTHILYYIQCRLSANSHSRALAKHSWVTCCNFLSKIPFCFEQNENAWHKPQCLGQYSTQGFKVTHHKAIHCTWLHIRLPKPRSLILLRSTITSCLYYAVVAISFHSYRYTWNRLTNKAKMHSLLLLPWNQYQNIKLR